jgi:ABC-type multidrug transport system ATPase subunit
MIKLKNINKKFLANEILTDINLNIEDGDFLHIEGANGSGKTTLLNIISGLISQDSGTIYYKNNNIVDKISFITSNIQSFYLRLSSYENLLFYGQINNVSLSIVKETIDKFDEIFNISDFLHKKMFQLSDGQKKKILITRSFLIEPQLILCDEITNFLDKDAKNKIIKFIKENNNNKNLTVIWVSHENKNTLELSNIKRYKLEKTKLLSNHEY